MGLEVVVLFAALGPLSSPALSVFLGDLTWSVVVRLRSRGDGGVVRAPSSLDA